MFAYIVIILISTLLVYISEHEKDDKIRRVFKYIAILFPAIMAGIRYGIGTDYFGVYEPLYNEIASGNTVDRMREFELGYVLINRIIIFFGGSFNIVMFVCSLITTYFTYKGLENYKDKINITFGFLLFMLFFYQKSFNIVRQIMSVSIVFYAFKYLKDKDKINLLKYFILVVIAGLFQRTVFIMLVIPFIKFIYENKKYNAIRITSFVVLLLIILNFETIGQIMASTGNETLVYYSYYFLQKGASGISIAYFLRVLPTIIPYFLLSRKIKEDKEMFLIYNMFIIGAILTLLGYLTTTFGERLALYFTIFQVVLIPYYIRISQKRANKIVLFVLLITVSIGTWYYDYIYMGREETIPYKTIFSVSKNEEIIKTMGEKGNEESFCRRILES